MAARNSQLQTAETMHVEITAHSIITYVLARWFRRHERIDWRPAFVESTTATAIDAPKKKDAISKPVRDVGLSLYQGGTSAPIVGVKGLKASRIEEEIVW